MKKIISGILAFIIFTGIISSPVSAYVQEEQNKVNVEKNINIDSDLVTNDEYGIIDKNLYNLLSDEQGKVSKLKLNDLKELTITNESNVSTLKGLDVCINLEKLTIESQTLNSLDGIESLENLKELVVNQGDKSNILSFSNISKIQSIEKVTLINIDSKRLDNLFGNENLKEINIDLNDYSREISLSIAKRLKALNSNLEVLRINTIDFMNQDLENKVSMFALETTSYSEFDVNSDGIIDKSDLDLVASHYNETKDSPNWDAKYDINKDGIIDIFDLVLISKEIDETNSTINAAYINSFNTNLPSGQAINEKITLSATSDLDKNVLYEFSVIGNFDDTWTILKSFNELNSAEWVPTKTGIYTLRVKTKHINSKEEFDDLADINFEVVGNIKSSKVYVSNYGRLDLNSKESPLIVITYEDDNVVYKVPDELKQDKDILQINSDKSITAIKEGTGKLIATYKGQEYTQNITVKDNKSLLEKYNNMTEEPLGESTIEVEINAKSTTEGIQLSWMYLPIISKYEIYRKDSTSDYVKIAELNGDLSPNEYLDKDVTANKEYTYRVDITTTDNTVQQLNELTISADKVVSPVATFNIQPFSDSNVTINSKDLEQFGTEELKKYLSKTQKIQYQDINQIRSIRPSAFDYQNVFAYKRKDTDSITLVSTNENLLPLKYQNYLIFGTSEKNLKINHDMSGFTKLSSDEYSYLSTFYNVKDNFGMDSNGDYLSIESNSNDDITYIESVSASLFYIYKYTTPDGEVIYPDNLTDNGEEEEDEGVSSKTAVNATPKQIADLTNSLAGVDPEDCEFKEGDEIVVFATNGAPYLARVYKIKEKTAMGREKLYAIPYDIKRFREDNKGPGDAKALLSILLDFTPIFSDVKDLYELLAGKDMITGEELNRGMMLLVLLTPVILDAPLKALAKKGVKSGPELIDALKKIGKSADDIVTDAIMKIKNKLKGNPDEVFEYVTETKDMGNYINCKTTDNISVDISKGELTDVEEKVLLDGCFIGSTLVETNKGPKRIDEIEIGDLVLAKNVLTGEIDYREVKKVYVKSISNLYNLVVSGELIQTTPSHLFMKENGEWVEAKDLVVGDKVVSSSGEVKIVENSGAKRYNESIKVYDLTVDEFSTYFVGNEKILVHNNTCSALVEAITRAKKNLDDYVSAIKNGKYGPEYSPATASIASDITDSTKNGYGCCSIYKNNPSVEDIVCNSTDEFVAHYRKMLTDEYIDELVKTTPDFFKGKDINSIKREMKKLRDRIQKTKDLAKAEGKYFQDNLGEPSFEDRWLVENCAEIWAVRDAILQGSKLENLVLRSVNGTTGKEKPFCKNCKITFEGIMDAMD